MKIKKIYRIIIYAFLIFFITSCSNASNSYDKTETGGALGDNDTQIENNVVIDSNRKIVYTVDYTITNDNMNNIKSLIATKTKEMSGYIKSSNEYTNSARIVYKIPTDQLNAFLDYVDSFKGIGSKQISSEDITTSYSYVEAKIDVLTASKASYENLLKNATSESAIIQYQKALDEIIIELNKINNEKNTYDNEINYSKVTIQYYSDVSIKTENDFFENYGSFLVSFIKGLGAFILYSLPFAIVFGLIFMAIFIPIRVKRNKKNK